MKIGYDKHTYGRSFAASDLTSIRSYLYGQETVRFQYVKDKVLETPYLCLD